MRERDRIALAGFVLVLVIGIFFLFVVKPKQGAADDVAAEVDEQRAALADAQTQLSQFRQAQASFDKDLRLVGSLTRALPVDEDVPDLLRQFERVARGQDVELGAVSLLPPEPFTAPAASGAAPAPETPPPAGTAAAAPATPAVQKIDVTLTFEGRYFAVRRFLMKVNRFVRVARRELRASGRLLTIGGFTLEMPPQTAPAIILDLTAAVYFAAPLGVAAVTPGAATPAPPATTTTTATTTTAPAAAP